MQPNPQRAHIPIELDRQRILCFDHRATFLLMKRYGLRPTSALYETIPEEGDKKKRVLRIRDMDVLVYFLWAGLQRDAQDAEETLTLEQVEEFVSPLLLEPIVYALTSALSQPLQRKNGSPAEAAGAQAGEAKSPRNTTGKRTSASPREPSV